MQLLKKSVIFLPLMTLLLTCAPAWHAAAQSPTPEGTTVVPTSLLREATARIDELELKLMFAQNRAVEKDSVWAGEKTYWMGRLAYAEETSAQWEYRYEKLSRSWWHKHESAFWLAIGVAGAAWALQ